MFQSNVSLFHQFTQKRKKMNILEKIKYVNEVATKVAKPGMSIEEIEALLPRVVDYEGHVFSYDAAVNAYDNLNTSKEERVKFSENFARIIESDTRDFSDAQ